MKFSNTIFAATGLFLAQPFFLSVAHAQGTPDDLPPALETWCDQYHGRDFGLCNSYCEAQDCEAPDADKNSCDGLREKFLARTGETRFPCEPSRCPCWDSIEALVGDDLLIGDSNVFDNGAQSYSLAFGDEGVAVSSVAVRRGTLCIGRNVDGTFVLRDLEEDDYDGCVNDVLVHATAISGVDGNMKSSCAPYPSSTATCPCWDGSDTSGDFPVFPGISGFTLDSSIFSTSRNGVNSYVTLDDGNYPIYHGVRNNIGTGLACTVKTNTKVLYNSAEYEACYNDILSWSAHSVGDNECHAFF
ncbi:expressed unknown protein [Seminavis robusta]|uniref:Uncharacterized protein n=1 Tax=Seminavis robusta TaxID=568900 RepID=A0A9N8HFW1_9STRA|nr:expressed unknown protein [Seminavis robusta]|eukprot:Sro477_g150900.1 n/a (301) ;mRNA; f:58595-59497